MHCLHLCKIGTIEVQKRDVCIDDTFEYKEVRWKVIENSLNKAKVLQILDILSNYQRSGFYLFVFENMLYVVYKVEKIHEHNSLAVQRKLLPLIFEKYLPEEDLSLNVFAVDKEQPVKLIKTHVTKKLYESLFLAHQQNSNEIDELEMPNSFLPKLPNFQKRTVKWLLKKEMLPGRIESYFKRFQAKDGITCIYKNLLCTDFRIDAPNDEYFYMPPGGILADEMGLGKTVEMLALMLLHKRKELTCLLTLPELEEDEIPLKKILLEKVVCICTGHTGYKKPQLIKCNQCQISQHKRCVTKYDSDHSSDINEPYLCPNCWKAYSETCLIKSGATCIVTPSTIRKQWLNEITRHISPKLRVCMYNGVSSGDWISPRQLANYDVVLTDYNVLRREFFHTNAQNSDRQMRKERRSLRLYTPLLMIEWWRVVIDEAQMVESDTSQTAALVRTLPAINRWAVSGTPIQRSVDDLYPLVRFIGLENCLIPPVWQTLVKDFMMHLDDEKNGVENRQTPILIKILCNFMWRTDKLQVKNELPIPPQSEKIHRIALSDLENFFYAEQHQECEEKFNEILNKYIERTDSTVSTSQQIMKIIMKPLLKIRQCCSIPTITAPNNKQTSAGVVQKQFLQPKELHHHLLIKTEKECKSHLRSICSAYNGLGAIYFIKGDLTNAVKNYEAVLKLANEYLVEKNITVDSLLQIHALYNILQARNLSIKFAATKSKETFEEYESQLNQFEWKYLETYASELKTVNEAFVKAKETLKTNLENSDMSLMDFLCTLLEIDDKNVQTQLFAKILDECIRKFGSMRLEAASSLRGVLYMIATWYEKLEKEQTAIENAFTELEFFTSNIKPRSQVSIQIWRDVSSFINTVCDCHVIELRELENDFDNDLEANVSSINLDRSRHKRVGQNLCKLCKLIKRVNNYECLLFKKSIDVTTNVVEGNENPQLEFEMIRIIFSFLKPKRTALSAEIEKHFKTLQSMQNFCKKAIKYWIEIEFTVKAFDELDMCKMRMTLTDDASERNNYKIMQHELELNFLRQEQNLKYAQECFSLKFARLKFIRYLAANSEMGTCPICRSDEEIRHTFLVCGHQICWSCFKLLRRLSHSSKLTCSICRNEQPVESVYFVTSTNKNSIGQCETIQGDFSSKLTYIVKLIKQLQRENENPNESVLDLNEAYPLKILIFSQWQSILNALATALKENNITYVQHSTVRTVEDFKNPDLGITCLLMPMSKGCKGLNLIEATHVFLMEPVLNLSEELQAIGRVHRFGQTKPTTVHRFIVDETIEENIYEVVSAGKGSSTRWEFDNMTFENLRELFKLQKI